jgi:hypothetical protein
MADKNVWSTNCGNGTLACKPRWKRLLAEGEGEDSMILGILAETMPLAELTNLGTAGLMGAMWLWERRTSRQREEQLDESHARIMGDRVQLDQLIEVVRHNAEAMSRLSASQEQLVRQFEMRKPG